jgi:acid phosphatase family membrane protein YuiD
MEGSHSPFGVIWQIATATGWSMHYILWKVNYQTLVMMSADAVRYVSAKKRKKKKSLINCFQTRLKT